MPRAKSSDFEKAFQELEEIVRRLESEELPLDESLQLFERGELAGFETLMRSHIVNSGATYARALDVTLRSGGVGSADR